MPYLFDYVEHELATFNQKPFGPVDAAVLSQACMIDGAGMVPEPSALPSLIDRAVALLAPDSRGVTFANLMRSELFEGMFTGLVPDDIRRLLMALAFHCSRAGRFAPARIFPRLGARCPADHEQA